MLIFFFPVDFDSFSKVLNRPGGFRDPGEPEEYCRGFQVFDKDMTGFIGVGQLRYSGFFLAFLFFYSPSQNNIFYFFYYVFTKVLWEKFFCVDFWSKNNTVLTNLGEKMSDEEVDELLKAVDTSSGEINYTGLSPQPPFFSELFFLWLLCYHQYQSLRSFITELVRTILAN